MSTYEWGVCRWSSLHQPSTDGFLHCCLSELACTVCLLMAKAWLGSPFFLLISINYDEFRWYLGQIVGSFCKLYGTLFITLFITLFRLLRSMHSSMLIIIPDITFYRADQTHFFLSPLSFQLGNIRHIRKRSFLHPAAAGVRGHTGELCKTWKWCECTTSGQV